MIDALVGLIIGSMLIAWALAGADIILCHLAQDDRPCWLCKILDKRR